MSSVIRGEDGFETSAGGIILQTRYAVFKGFADFDYTDGSIKTIDVLSVNITPKSDKSVFKLELSLCYSAGINNSNVMFGALRNNFYIQNSGTLSKQTPGISPLVTNRQTYANNVIDMGIYGYVDAPNTTSNITYKPTIKAVGNFKIAINRTFQNGDTPDFETGLSTFIVTELSGT